MKRIFAALLLALFTCASVAQVPIYTRPQGAATGLNNAANVAITGGTISGATLSTTPGAVNILNQGGIPFISAPTGTITAPGAITLGTALPAIYPDGYCFLPANAVATVASAGWYYCTFSSTTVGTVFLNTYTSGAATIPSSPTAVTDGKGAYTGDTGEEFGLTLNVPILTATSVIRIGTVVTNNNTAGVKTYRTRLSGNAGTIFISSLGASTLGGSYTTFIANTGSVSKQYSSLIGQSVITPTVQIFGTVNTGVATSLVFSLQKATATDVMVLFPPFVELMY